jgi:hypothetical protein
MAEATARQHRDDNQAECGTKASHGTFCWNELMTRDV